MPFDPEAVPVSARQLIAQAAVWAIGDDYDREAALGRATDHELRHLVDGVGAAGDDFWEWLAARLPLDRLWPGDPDSPISPARGEHRAKHLDEIKAALRARS